MINVSRDDNSHSRNLKEREREIANYIRIKQQQWYFNNDKVPLIRNIITHCKIQFNYMIVFLFL